MVIILFLRLMIRLLPISKNTIVPYMYTEGNFMNLKMFRVVKIGQVCRLEDRGGDIKEVSMEELFALYFSRNHVLSAFPELNNKKYIR